MEDIEGPSPGKVILMPHTLSAGFEYPNSKIALIAHTKVSARLSQPKSRRRHKEGKRIRALSDLSFGDYAAR